MSTAVLPCDAAAELLHSLSGPTGIHASASHVANYAAVFARDGVMAGIAGLLTKDTIVIDGFVRTLRHLRDLQGPEGQIASNYLLPTDAPAQVSFGTLVPRIDAPLWFLIGVGLGARAGALDPAEFRDAVQRVVRLLDAIEYNGRHLLYVPVGANWADEYVTEGYVLHEQVLRAWALRLVGATYDVAAWRRKSEQVEDAATRTFASRDAAHPYPLAAVSPVRVNDTFDLATTTLLGVSGVCTPLRESALAWVDAQFVSRDQLPPAYSPVIDDSHPDWPALNRYQLHGFRNRPHEYHNGGIWPIWLGWLALAFARTGRQDARERLTRTLASLPALGDGFAFEEYFHGRTGVAMGTAQMAYTATGLLFFRAAGDPAALALFAL